MTETRVRQDRGGRGYPDVSLPKWISVHYSVPVSIYDPRYDRELRRLIIPQIAAARATGLISKAFFVRYSLGGPHIRLRVLPSSASAHDLLLNRLLEAPPNASTGRVAEQVPYVPELERYCGPYAMPAAETWFDASTKLVLDELTPHVSDDRSWRFARALLAVVVGAYAMLETRDALSAFAVGYARDYLRTIESAGWHSDSETTRRAVQAPNKARLDSLTPYVIDAVERIESGESLTPELDAYLAVCRDVSRTLRQLAAQGQTRTQNKVFRSSTELASYLLPSLIHMTSNRFGITILEEVYLATTLSACLKER